MPDKTPAMEIADSMMNALSYTRVEAQSATATIAPWGSVKSGDVVLSRGEIVTIREVWPTWEKGVGMTVSVEAAPDREAHAVHREEHIEALTAVLASSVDEHGGEVFAR